MTIALLLGGTALSGFLGNQGAQGASQAQQQAQQQALAFQQQAYQDQQRNLYPWISTGQGALGTIANLYGLNGGTGFNENALNTFRSSPDYAFAFREGQRALDNSAAARGGMLGGNYSRALTQYGQGMATNYLDNYTKRLLGIADSGRTAALGQGQLGATMGSQIGNTFGNIGTAQASGIVGGTNALTGALGSGINNYLLMSALNNRGSSYGGVNRGGSFLGMSTPWPQMNAA